MQAGGLESLVGPGIASPIYQQQHHIITTVTPLRHIDYISILAYSRLPVSYCMIIPEALVRGSE